MGTRGPVGASESELRLRGAYRKGRHSQRRDETASGAPVKPSRLKGDASRFWDSNIGLLLEAVAIYAIDSEVLAMACELFALRQATYVKLDKSPLDGKARRAYLAYHAAFMECAKRVGLEPMGRMRLPKP